LLSHYFLINPIFHSYHFSLQNIVEKGKQDAYKNVNNNLELEPIDEAFLNSISLAACLKSAAQLDAPVQGLQHIDISTAQGIIFGYFICLLCIRFSIGEC
jgi:hypothetical protein